MFAEHFQKLKLYHHFHFDASMPGTVSIKVASDSEERIVLQTNESWFSSSSDLPEPVYPASLSLQRQWYLYNNIAEYCREAVREKVCPKLALHQL